MVKFGWNRGDVTDGGGHLRWITDGNSIHDDVGEAALEIGRVVIEDLDHILLMSIGIGRTVIGERRGTTGAAGCSELSHLR